MASAGNGPDAAPAVQACGDLAVILVDDADSRPDVVALLEQLAACRDGSPVRVILIARTSGLPRRLASAIQARLRPAIAAALEVSPIDMESRDDRARWYAEAVRAYARRCEPHRRNCRATPMGDGLTPPSQF
jgi:hypothetical protein